jgi:hypothetical protein
MVDTDTKKPSRVKVPLAYWSVAALPDSSVHFRPMSALRWNSNAARQSLGTLYDSRATLRCAGSFTPFINGNAFRSIARIASATVAGFFTATACAAETGVTSIALLPDNRMIIALRKTLNRPEDMYTRMIEYSPLERNENSVSESA